MQLPVMPPVSPMLAKLCRQMPEGEGLVYEPKWDGFRCMVFRDGAELELGSRNERPLTRYFPELVESLLANLPERCVLDGEIVIAGPSGLDFDALLQRIHPAASRVRLLASSTPSSFVAFDLLALGEDDLRPAPFASRRSALEQALSGAKPPVYLTPATSDPAVARDWFSRFEGAGLDGVVAKPAELSYREGERVMLKVKHERTADCVVGGFRWHKDAGGVGSFAPRPVRRARGASPCRGGVRFCRGPAQEPRGRPRPVPVGGRRGPSLGGDGPRRPTARAGRDHQAGGTRAGTCPGSPWHPSSCARSPTTISRATGSAMPPRSAAGGPTAGPSRAPTPSSRSPCPRSSPGSSAPGAEPGLRARRGPPCARPGTRRVGTGTCPRIPGWGPASAARPHHRAASDRSGAWRAP